MRRETRQPRICTVYLVRLERDGDVGVYVGTTAHDPKTRLLQHKSGYRDSTVVRKYGTGILQTYGPFTRENAGRAEKALHDYIKSRGVWSEHGL